LHLLDPCCVGAAGQRRRLVGSLRRRRKSNYIRRSQHGFDSGESHNSRGGHFHDYVVGADRFDFAARQLFGHPGRRETTATAAATAATATTAGSTNSGTAGSGSAATAAEHSGPGNTAAKHAGKEVASRRFNLAEVVELADTPS
jgi:hypothetical protein